MVTLSCREASKYHRPEVHLLKQEKQKHLEKREWRERGDFGGRVCSLQVRVRILLLFIQSININ